MAELSDQDQTRLALAALFAALAGALGERDKSFPEAFSRHLSALHSELVKDGRGEPGVLDALRWTHEMMSPEDLTKRSPE